MLVLYCREVMPAVPIVWGIRAWISPVESMRRVLDLVGKYRANRDSRLWPGCRIFRRRHESLLATCRS